MTCPECGQPVETAAPYCMNAECGALLPSVLPPPTARPDVPTRAVVASAPADPTTASPSPGSRLLVVGALLALVLTATVVWLVQDRPERGKGVTADWPTRPSLERPTTPALESPTAPALEADDQVTPVPVEVVLTTPSRRSSPPPPPTPGRTRASAPPYLTATVTPFCRDGASSTWAFTISGRLHNASAGHYPYGGLFHDGTVYSYGIDGSGSTSFSGTIPPSSELEHELRTPTTEWRLGVYVYGEVPLGRWIELSGTVSNPC